MNTNVKKYTAEQSSNVRSIEHTENGSLLVEFSNGKKYAYANVPREIFDAAVVAESIGKFMAAQVKGKFSFQELV